MGEGVDKMPKDNKYSECCTCGFKWITGQDGHHSCSEVLLSRLKKLELELKQEKRLGEVLLVSGKITQETYDKAKELISTFS